MSGNSPCSACVNRQTALAKLPAEPLVRQHFMSHLICFVCIRMYPYVKSSKNQEISWAQPVDKRNHTVFGLSPSAAETCLCLRTFKEKYVTQAKAFAQQEMNSELEDWISEAQLGEQKVPIVCCPEDKVCNKRCPSEKFCSQYWVPLCATCRRDLVWHGRQPAAALGNDMMVYYSPKEVFALEVTVMEMLCASPCLTTMICFSLELKLRGERALDQDAWMNRQCMAFRWTATTFPLHGKICFSSSKLWLLQSAREHCKPGKLPSVRFKHGVSQAPGNILAIEQRMQTQRVTLRNKKSTSKSHRKVGHAG